MNPEMFDGSRLNKSYVRKEPKSEPKSRAAKRGKPLKQVSHKQALDNAKWAGIKEAFLYLLGPDAVCGFCETRLHSGELIDAHHIIPKGRGGRSVAENCELVHRRCHTKRHRNLPEWSEGRAS